MITGPQVLAPDVVIVAVGTLGRQVRRLRVARDGYAISRPGGRRPSKIIDRDSARLLELFRSPRRIVDAVLEFSRADGADPRAALAGAFPMLNACRAAGFLVAADSLEARRILPMLERGDRVGAWRVERCVQVLEDVELYQLRSRADVAALKVARPGAGGGVHQQLGNEARILRCLRGRGVPRLLEETAVAGRPALLMAWCEGVSPLLAAAELRESDRGGLLRLAGAIAEAYAKLHTRGVIHGDVDPRNLLIDAGGRVTILDFGLSRLADDRQPAPRAGISLLHEPEFARAELARRRPPAATPASDQYALGALLYLLFTGEHYFDVSLDTGTALRQIATATPLPFARRGVAPWPGVERMLARALRKSRTARHPSVTTLAAALRAERRREPRRQKGQAVGGAGAPLDRVASRVLADLDIIGPGFARPMEAPSASVKFGAAGIALALYRRACQRDDARLLSWADVWLARAEREAATSGGRAFYSDALGVPRTQVGVVSPYHTASGIHLVRAQISQAGGDLANLGAAVSGFVAASRAACSNLDLTLGRSGTLLGAALLLDALPAGTRQTAVPLRDLGGQRLATLWRSLARRRVAPSGTRAPSSGMAHGWAGMLYATMRWCSSAGSACPPGLEQRLDELAGAAEPAGRGVRWPATLQARDGAPATGYASGWCNGSAGLVHLWTLAFQVTGRAQFLDLAVRSAWHAWEDAERGASLCCGLAGRSYALLNLYRHTGEAAWLARARSLGDRAAREVLARRAPEPLSRSLYKGDVGLLALAGDLERPETARMPMLEDEGWPTRPTK